MNHPSCLGLSACFQGTVTEFLRETTHQHTVVLPTHSFTGWHVNTEVSQHTHLNSKLHYQHRPHMKHSFHTRSTCPLFARWESWSPTAGDSEHPQITPAGGKRLLKDNPCMSWSQRDFVELGRSCHTEGQQFEGKLKAPCSAGILCILHFNLVKTHISYKVVWTPLFLWCCPSPSLPTQLNKRHTTTPQHILVKHTLGLSLMLCCPWWFYCWQKKRTRAFNALLSGVRTFIQDYTNKLWTAITQY